MRAELNDHHLTMRLPTEHYKQLKALAAGCDRTVADLLREAIEVIVRDAPQSARTRAQNPFLQATRERRGKAAA